MKKIGFIFLTAALAYCIGLISLNIIYAGIGGAFCGYLISFVAPS